MIDVGPDGCHCRFVNGVRGLDCLKVPLAAYNILLCSLDNAQHRVLAWHPIRYCNVLPG